MLYVKSRKNFKVRRQKKIYYFAVCQNKTHGKVRVSKKHTANYFFAVCKKKHMAKHVSTVCYIFAVCTHGKEVLCRVPNKKHTVNYQAHRKGPVSGSDYLLDQEFKMDNSRVAMTGIENLDNSNISDHSARVKSHLVQLTIVKSRLI